MKTVEAAVLLPEAESQDTFCDSSRDAVSNLLQEAPRTSWFKVGTQHHSVHQATWHTRTTDCAIGIMLTKERNEIHECVLEIRSSVQA
jgi:hypothetical protein